MHLTLTRRLTCSIFLWPASKTVVPDFFSSGYSGLNQQPPIWQGFFALLRLLRKFQYENLLWSDSDIRTHLTIYLYYIVRFVCRSLDNNVKAAVVRARVGQSDGHGGGILNRRSGMPGWICCTRRSSSGVQGVKECTSGDNLSFILKSTLISDVHFSCSGSNRSAATTKSLLHPQG